jgi:16S rRNA (uracil1498-N3)-methyltransferase
LGGVFETSVATVEKRRVTVAIQSHRAIAAPAWQIHLAIGMLKNKALDQVLSKAVEIGVTSLTLLDSVHSVSRIDPDEISRKTEGWRDSLIEAAKQCGNPWLPSLVGPTTVSDFLRSKPEVDLLLAAVLRPGAVGLKAVATEFAASYGRSPRTALVTIGPEGDFSSAEIEALLVAGFRPITMGSNVLRAETAATVAAAVLRHELSA